MNDIASHNEVEALTNEVEGANEVHEERRAGTSCRPPSIRIPHLPSASDPASRAKDRCTSWPPPRHSGCPISWPTSHIPIYSAEFGIIQGRLAGDDRDVGLFDIGLREEHACAIQLVVVCRIVSSRVGLLTVAT